MTRGLDKKAGGSEEEEIGRERERREEERCRGESEREKLEGGSVAWGEGEQIEREREFVVRGLGKKMLDRK